jgi:hypothetical protein
MTIHEFLEALKDVKAVGYRPYMVSKTYGQAIRLESPAGAEHCPITAVCERHTGQTLPTTAVYSSLDLVGLSPDDAYAIAAATDSQALEPLLRAQILAALGLQEAQPL